MSLQPASRPPRTGIWPDIRLVGLAASLVFALAYLNLAETSARHVTAPLWPANAVLIAVMSRLRPRLWPLAAGLGVAAMVAASLLRGTATPLAFALPLANGVDALLCVAGLRWAGTLPPDLRRLKDAGAFLVFGGLVAPLAAGLIAATARQLAGSGQFLQNLFDWWAARGLGTLVFTPALLAITPARLWRLVTPRRRWWALGLTTALALFLAAVFLQTRYPALFTIMPLLMLITFFLGLTGGALAILATTLVALYATLQGLGPFALIQGDAAEQMMFLQVFLLFGVVTVVAVAVLVEREQRSQRERIRLRDELIESERRFRAWADNASDVVAYSGLDSVFLYLSPSVERLLGYTPDELVGKSIEAIVHPDDLRDANRAIRARVLAPREAERPPVIYRVITKTGAVLWVEARPELLRDPDTGEPVGVSDIVSDITARREIAASLRAAKEAAEEATRAKTDFLANMSHEIRTPLTAILGFSSLLENLDSLSEEARRYVRRIVAGGRVLLSVVNDILDFSKLEAGQVHLDPAPFDPHEFVQATAELISPQIEAKGLSFDLALSPGLPPSLIGDSTRLRQILLNLLNNAVKFTSKGGVRLSADYDPGSGELCLVVADTGTGIPADKLDQLFERFSQVDSSVSRHYGGTGLGLAICKSLLDLMAGRITVESEVGRGTRIEVHVPAPQEAPAASRIDPPPRAEPAQEEPAGAVPTANATPAEVGPATPARILVVDDVAENRELVRLLLDFMGHGVEEAAGGEEACRLAQAERFDLILMDMQMPKVDGLAASRRIRASGGPNADTPILAFTANVLGDQVEQCLAAGMNDHISKPILADELTAKVRQWMSRAPGAVAAAPGD